jgi:hypothetical protein
LFSGVGVGFGEAGAAGCSSRGALEEAGEDVVELLDELSDEELVVVVDVAVSEPDNALAGLETGSVCLTSLPAPL